MEIIKMPRINTTRVVENIRNFEEELMYYEAMLKERIRLNKLKAEIPVFSYDGKREIGTTLSSKRLHRLDTYEIQKHILLIEKAIKREKDKYNSCVTIWKNWENTEFELRTASDKLEREFAACIQALEDLNIAYKLVEPEYKEKMQIQINVAYEEMLGTQKLAIAAKRRFAKHVSKRPQKVKELEEFQANKKKAELPTLDLSVLGNNPNTDISKIKTAAEMKKADAASRRLEKISNQAREEELLLEANNITLESIEIPLEIDITNMSEFDIQETKKQLLDLQKSKIAKELMKLKGENLVI
jgi:hypothetical protein